MALRRDHLTDASFDVVMASIGGLSQEIRNLQAQMVPMQNSALMGQLVPVTPSFKLGQNDDPNGDGVNVNVGVTGVAGNMQSARITVVRKVHNQVLPGETTIQALNRIKTKFEHFDIDLTDIERASGTLETVIGPFKKRHMKDTSEGEKDKNRFQLVRLRAYTDFSSSPNPVDSPVNPTATVPINVFSVNPAGATQFYFDLVDNKNGSPPADDKVCDILENATESTTSSVSFTLLPLSTNNGGASDLSFEDRGFNEARAFIRKRGTTGRGRVLGGVLDDPTVKTITYTDDLPVGKEFEWYQNVYSGNGTKEVVTPASPVYFVVGSGSSAVTQARLDGFSIIHVNTTGDFAVLQFAAEDDRHGILTLTITQPTFSMACGSGAYLYKRVIFEKSQNGTTWHRIGAPFRTLDDAGAFDSGGVNVLTQEVQTKKNIAAIYFRARIFLAGKTSANAVPTLIVPVQGTSMSTLIQPPADPVAGDFAAPAENAVDDSSMSTAEVRCTFPVRLNTSLVPPGSTFASLGIDSAYVKVRKVKSGTGTSPQDDPGAAGSTVGENKLKFQGGPIDPADLASNVVYVALDKLKYKKRYEVVRVALASGGILVKCPTHTNLPFIAGQGNVDIATLSAPNPPITIARKSSQHSKVKCSFIQPASPSPGPLFLENITLFQQEPGDTEASAIGFKDLSTDNGFQVSGPLSVSFKAVHGKGIPAGMISYYYVIMANGGGIYTSSTITDSATGTDAPTTAPSAPSLSSTYLSTNTPDVDASTGDAQVVVRVFCDSANTSTSTGLTWGANLVQLVTAIFQKTSGIEIPFTAVPEPTATYVDIPCNLKLGHTYLWLKNKSSNGEGHINSTGSAVSIKAGGLDENLSLLASPNFNVNLAKAEPQDIHHSLIAIEFTQPATPVFANKIVLFADKNGSGTFLPRGEVILRDDAANFTPGLKTVYVAIQHTKMATLRFYARMHGRLNSPIQSATTANYVTSVGEDLSAPAYSASNPITGRLKWGAMGLKIKTNPPDINYTNPSLTRVLLEFQTWFPSPFPLLYAYAYWNPDDGSTGAVRYSASPIILGPDSPNWNDSSYNLPIGVGASRVIYDVLRPRFEDVPASFSAGLVTNSLDLPLELARFLNGESSGSPAINDITGVLTVKVIFYNQTPDGTGLPSASNLTPFSYVATFPALMWRRGMGFDKPAVMI